MTVTVTGPTTPVDEAYARWYAFEMERLATEVMANIYATWPVVTGRSISGFYIILRRNEIELRNSVPYVPFVEARYGYIDAAFRAAISGHRQRTYEVSNRTFQNIGSFGTGTIRQDIYEETLRSIRQQRRHFTLGRI